MSGMSRGMSEMPLSEQMPSDGARNAEALVGGVGQEFVQSELTRSDKTPQQALIEIRRKAGLRNPRCVPLMGLLDQLGKRRAEAYKGILDAARDTLLGRVDSLPPAKLLELLEMSFPFISIPELRAVPLAVLGRLAPVPAAYLRQLATDKEVFPELPENVQRQVWEVDKTVLQQHALPALATFTYEVANVERALGMDRHLPPPQLPPGTKAPVPRPLPRRAERRRGGIQQLAKMVGRSWQVYKGIIELCMIKYRDSEGLYVGLTEAAFCTARSQLIMNLHDAGITELCNQDPCHKLAWTLDACLNDRSLDARRLRELQNFFAPHDTAGAMPPPRPSGGGGKRQKQRHNTDNDAESVGAPGRSGAQGPQQGGLLGNAGMVLRDPSTFHLVVHQVLRRLEAVVEAESVPTADPELRFMTRLLQLAVASKSQLRERAYSMPPASEDLMHKFYPLLAGAMLEADVNSVEDEGQEAMNEAAREAAAEPGVVKPELVTIILKDEIARRVAQMYTLECLARTDLATARDMLVCLAAALERLSKGIAEWAPFAYCLAGRLEGLMKFGLVVVGTPFWTTAVDQLLLHTINADTRVHDAVLRLLLAASGKLPPEQLGRYLQTTIQNSRKSRRRFKRRGVDSAAPPVNAGYSSGGYSSGGLVSGYRSAGALNGGTASEGQDPESKHNADGVRSTYNLFASVKGLTEANAPLLFQYLKESKSEKDKDEG